MKENNSEDEEDFNYSNNMNEEKFGQTSDFNQKQIISPFRSNENSPINNKQIEAKEESNNYFYNIFNMANKMNWSNDNINDNFQFIRYPLKDDQKIYLTPRNKTMLYKILDFFFNW